MLAPSRQNHPLWGRPLERYTHAYQLNTTRKEIHGTMPRLQANSAAQQIGTYSDWIGTLDSAEQVTLSTLETILKMANDDDTYKNFLSPRLMGGCIALMQTVKVSGKTSVRRVLDFDQLLIGS